MVYLLENIERGVNSSSQRVRKDLTTLLSTERGRRKNLIPQEYENDLFRRRGKESKECASALGGKKTGP